MVKAVPVNAEMIIVVGISHSAVDMPIKMIHSHFRMFTLRDILHNGMIMHDFRMVLRWDAGGGLRYPSSPFIMLRRMDLPIVVSKVRRLRNPLGLGNRDAMHLVDGHTGPGRMGYRTASTAPRPAVLFRLRARANEKNRGGNRHDCKMFLSIHRSS
jgi:hypothetical protein